MGSLPATTEAHRFGKYSLVARLATGGMAEIFLARLEGAGGFAKLVCIKRILPHLARDKQFVAMFFGEARIASQISHPNVCQVFELGEIDGSYYLAMEYMEGVPLACYRGRRDTLALPEPRLVAGIAVQACEGLHHAHQLKNADGSDMGVVHRDVSASNLFVTVDGVVKVLDFGIAKAQGAAVRTMTGTIKGTYAYMSPEQLRGERVDRRTDVFALGVVMWETLARRHLFRRDTDFLTFQAITSDPIEDVRVYRPDVSPGLASVIMTALSRDREQRFPSTRLLGEAIAQTIAPMAGSAISEDIARAFPIELGDQAELIRVAREGRVYALDLDRGPRFNDGDDVLTTPTSNQYPYFPPPTPVPMTSTAPGNALPAGPRSQDVPVASPRTGTAQVARPSRWRPVVIATAALAVGAGAALAYGALSQPAPAVPPAPSVASAAPPPVAAPAPATATPAPPAPPAAPSVTGSAAPTEGSAGGAPATDPAPTAPTTAAKSSETGKSSDTQPPRTRSAAQGSSAAATAAKPSGPPGFITIDSTPVYAVIYIDGKHYGETPLVKLALPPGRHTVRAVTSSGATREVRITIESGKVAPATRIEW